MPPKPHPKRAAIARLLRKGLTHPEIAARLDVSVPLVGKVARVNNLTRKQGRRPGGRREAVLALASKGVAPGKIALALKCSRRLVDTYLLEQRSKDSAKTQPGGESPPARKRERPGDK